MSEKDEAKELARMVVEFFQAARDQGLYIGAGRDGARIDDEEHQYGPLSKALLKRAKEIAS